MATDRQTPNAGFKVMPSGSKLLGRVVPVQDASSEQEWFKNLTNPLTRKAYAADIKDFLAFAKIKSREDWRSVRSLDIIDWRVDMENRKLSARYIRRRLAALSSVLESLRSDGVIFENPAQRVRRPRCYNTHSDTPTLNNEQAKSLLDAPEADTLLGKRDRAILATLLFHGLRRAELCKLQVQHVNHIWGGRPHIKIEGKGGKTRYVLTHPRALELVQNYLSAAGHATDSKGPLFRPVKNNAASDPAQRGNLEKSLTPPSVYLLVKKYAKKAGIKIQGLCAHSLRATAATNALENHADITEVQKWLGHANISTTQIYDHRHQRAENSPTLKVLIESTPSLSNIR